MKVYKMLLVGMMVVGMFIGGTVGYVAGSRPAPVVVNVVQGNADHNNQLREGEDEQDHSTPLLDMTTDGKGYTF